MKSFLKAALLAAILFAMSPAKSDAQTKTQYLRTLKGKMMPLKVDTATTFNATPRVVDTIAVSNGDAGVIEVTVTGAASDGDAVTGKLIYRYKKVSGTLTVATADTASAVTVDTDLSGAGFALAANSYNNLKLTLTGKASTTITWRALIVPLFKY